jgi:signal transduction histidine kinase
MTEARSQPVRDALSILVVDDDDGDRMQVKRSLRQAGLSCECIEAVSIDAALAACAERAFDCAIVDYLMPGCDGLHGIAALHERHPDMAIIMATGQGDEIVAAKAMRNGAAHYIPKMHIDAQSIRRTVDYAVEMSALRRKVSQQRRELENFAAMLAHDLKAPINSIQAYARFIDEGLRADPVDKNAMAGYCRRVVGAGRRMGALIDALHEYTKPDGQVPAERVDMHQVMRDTLSNLEHIIQQRGARVTYGALPAVLGNAPQLTQLLQNLVANGIKYCEAAIPTVHVAAGPDLENFRLFTVKDNGIGIPREAYRQIFEPFKRLHSGSQYEGTGLGLATCRNIVGRSGGKIWCESEAGVGTTFFFTLPGVPSNA